MARAQAPKAQGPGPMSPFPPPLMSLATAQEPKGQGPRAFYAFGTSVVKCPTARHTTYLRERATTIRTRPTVCAPAGQKQPTTTYLLHTKPIHRISNTIAAITRSSIIFLRWNATTEPLLWQWLCRLIMGHDWALISFRPRLSLTTVSHNWANST